MGLTKKTAEMTRFHIEHRPIRCETLPLETSMRTHVKSSIDKLLQLFKVPSMPKKNTYHSRCDFFGVKLLTSKSLTSINDAKRRKTVIREKILDIKFMMELSN